MVSKHFFVIMCVGVFIQLLIACNVHSETWKITSLDWQPYSGIDMVNQGNSVEKLKKHLKSEGIDLVVVFYPWLRAQKKAKTPQYIGYFPAWPEEVKEGFVASPVVDYSFLGVLTYEGSNITWTSIDDMFAHHTVGVIQTYVYPKDIEAAMQKYPENVDYAPDEVALFKKLSNKRDAIAIIIS